MVALMKYNDSATRERVIEKTIELLKLHGVRGWNMDKLSAETALAKNTLYRIVGSKEKLMERVALKHCKRIYGRLLHISETSDDYFLTLEKLLQTYSEISPAYFAEIFIEYPGVKSTVETHFAEAKQRLIDYIAAGIRAGHVKDLGAEKIFELLRSIGFFFISVKDERERSEKIQFAFQCVLHGIVNR